jgi:hypothetical protein
MTKPLTEQQIKRQVELATNVVDKSYLMSQITYGKYKQLIAAINLWAEIEYEESKKMKEHGFA